MCEHIFSLLFGKYLAVKMLSHKEHAMFFIILKSLNSSSNSPSTGVVKDSVSGTIEDPPFGVILES